MLATSSNLVNLSDMANSADEYDSPWKECLEFYLQSIMELCFPSEASNVDWSVTPEFFDKELQEILRDSAHGRQIVDKLVKLRLKQGTEQIVFFHFEVKNQPEPDFTRWLFQAYTGIRWRYGLPVATFAIIADENPNWFPLNYQEGLLSTKVQFDFASCKLLKLVENRRAELSLTKQPAAILILANWMTQQSKQNMELRLSWKWDLVKTLYEKGYHKNQILSLFRLIDWMMWLPKEQTFEFRTLLCEYERKNLMPYITSIEQLGREEGLQKGIEKGLQQGIEKGLQQGIETGLKQGIQQERQQTIVNILENRFGPVSASLQDRVAKISDLGQLAALKETAFKCPSLADFERLVNELGA